MTRTNGDAMAVLLVTHLLAVVYLATRPRPFHLCAAAQRWSLGPTIRNVILLRLTKKWSKFLVGIFLVVSTAATAASPITAAASSVRGRTAKEAWVTSSRCCSPATGATAVAETFAIADLVVELLPLLFLLLLL